MTKLERQRIAIRKVRHHNYNGILHFCTRFGKTRVGLGICKDFFDTGQVPLILVPSNTVKQGWLKEDDISLKLHPTIITASQLLSLDTTIVIDLLIVDEVHKFLTDANYELINGNKIKYKYLICLTATLPIDDRLTKLMSLTKVIDVITEKEAIQNNWVSNYIEYNIPLELSDANKLRYVKYTSRMADVFNSYKDLYKFITYNGKLIFRDDLDLINSCHSGKYTKEFGFIPEANIREAVRTKMGNSWTVEDIEKTTKQFSSDIRLRNDIVIANSLKLHAVLHIYNKLQTPTICFNESIGFTDKLADTLNSIYDDIAFSYHSKTPSAPLINPATGDWYRYKGGAKADEPRIFSKTKQLEYAMAAISAGHLRFISTVKALDEGITIPNVDCIITTSGSMNPIQYEQRTGRGKTFVDEDKIAKVYNLYFDDFELDGKQYKSRDKFKLLSRQINSINIKEISLHDV